MTGSTSSPRDTLVIPKGVVELICRLQVLPSVESAHMKVMLMHVPLLTPRSESECRYPGNQTTHA